MTIFPLHLNKFQQIKVPLSNKTEICPLSASRFLHKKICPLQPKVKYESITRISAKKVIRQKMRDEFQIIK